MRRHDVEFSDLDVGKLPPAMGEPSLDDAIFELFRVVPNGREYFVRQGARDALVLSAQRGEREGSDGYYVSEHRCGPRSRGVFVSQRAARFLGPGRARRDGLERSDSTLIENLNAIATREGLGRVTRPSQLIYDPSSTRLLKAGITPGRRRYEVLDTPLHRTIMIFSGSRARRVHQWTSLRPEIVSAFQWDTVGKQPTNKYLRGRALRGFPRAARGKRQSKFGLGYLPDACPILEEFVSTLASAVPLPRLDLAGTYAPQLREVRLRKIANLLLEMTIPPALTGKLPVSAGHVRLVEKILAKSGYPDQAVALRDAYRCSELDSSMVRAISLARAARAALGSDQILAMGFAMRFSEVLG